MDEPSYSDGAGETVSEGADATGGLRDDPPGRVPWKTCQGRPAWPRKPWWLMGGFALCLFVSSASLFRKYMSEPALILYALVTVAGVVCAWYAAPRLHARLTERRALGLIILVLLSLIAVFLIGYPLANSGRLGQGSDRDEALDIGAARLMAGQYPYHAQTYLDNPISPLPGALLLAAPFVKLGSSAYQNLFWLVLFLAIARLYMLDTRYTLFVLLSLLLLAPVVVSELVTGSDLLANGLYVLVALLIMVRTHSDTSPVVATLKAILLGVTLSSRANFLLIGPVVFAALVEGLGRTKAIRYSVIALSSFAAITLPFWLYDPAGFSPLHTIDKLRIFDVILPHSEVIFPLAAGAVSLGLACRQVSGQAVLLRNCAIIQAVPVLLGVLLPVLLTGDVLLSYGSRFGGSFLFFAALHFWQRCQGQAPTNDLDTVKTREYFPAHSRAPA